MTRPARPIAIAFSFSLVASFAGAWTESSRTIEGYLYVDDRQISRIAVVENDDVLVLVIPKDGSAFRYIFPFGSIRTSPLLDRSSWELTPEEKLGLLSKELSKDDMMALLWLAVIDDSAISNARHPTEFVGLNQKLDRIEEKVDCLLSSDPTTGNQTPRRFGNNRFRRNSLDCE